MIHERVPFDLAIRDASLLKKSWERLSLPQQVVLKAFYGLPLKTEREILIWSGFQGEGIYDDLGYLLGIRREVPYVPKEYSIITGVLGRRSGKSTEVGGFIGAYEITLGGHTRFAREGQDLDYLYVAQDMTNAVKNMKGIILTLKQSPLLSKEIVKEGVEEWGFANGIILRAQPNNVKASRGSAVVGAQLDELGFWYKDAKSANPDKEVEVSIAYAMQQFEPFAKQARFTTPWTKEGLAYEAAVAGTEGRLLPPTAAEDEREQWEDHLVVYAPTAAMEIPEPLVTRKKLARKKKRNPEAFERESLAKFIDSQSGFLAHAKVNEAVETGVTSRAVIPNAPYVAVMDPAYRNDSFVLSIGHMEEKEGLVQDFNKSWEPPPGGRLSPALVLDEVKTILDQFGLNVIYSDQHEVNSMQQLAIDRNFTIFGMDWTKTNKPKLMLDLANRLNQNKVKLLDIPEQTRQLKALQKKVLPSGHVQITAPPNEHDDYAIALGMLAYYAGQLPPLTGAEKVAGNPIVSHDRDNQRALILQRNWEAFEARVAAGDPEAIRALEWTEYLKAMSE